MINKIREVKTIDKLSFNASTKDIFVCSFGVRQNFALAPKIHFIHLHANKKI
jgi:hypothetical protein